MSEKLLCLILARGGSKGIPQKNLQKVGDKSLLTHTLESCQRLTSYLSIDLVVSTDCREIKAEALKHRSVVVIDRPKELALDHTPSSLACLHTIEYLETKNQFYDTLALFQPTSPFWNLQTFLTLHHKYLIDSKAQSAVPITRVSTHPDKMVKLDGGYAHSLLHNNFNNSCVPRQSLEPVYRRTGAYYITSINAIKRSLQVLNQPTLAVEETGDYLFDIDSPIDLD